MKLQNSFVRRTSTFLGVSKASWRDWHWQQRNRVRDLKTLRKNLKLTVAEVEAFEAAEAKFRVAITPHYLAMMDQEDPGCPVRMQAVPHFQELAVADFELADPLAEEAHMPVSGLTHRYPDRALLYVSHNCPVYCRHCTRKRKVADPLTASTRGSLGAAITYIRDTPQIRDVILSGGDPLSLSNGRLRELLSALRTIPHIDVIRLGTRNPVTLPQRVDDAFCDIVREYGPVYVHTHFNHVRELSEESAQALTALLSAGAVLGNQMVLLRGVNDTIEDVLDLNRALLRLGCRPYYMLQCDMAEGISHFRTPIQTGLDIVAGLRGRIGGMGIPDFVVDLPGGGGKVELTPEYIVGEQPHPRGRLVTFRNYSGAEFDLVDVYSAET